MITRQQFVERNTLLVEDLRNPENKQTKGFLRRDTGFCCLGRACEVFRQNTGTGEWEPVVPDSRVYKFDVKEAGSTQYEPPHKVADWFGWHISVNPALNGQSVTMSGLNDEHSKSFPEIAAILESHIEAAKGNYPERD